MGVETYELLHLHGGQEHDTCCGGDPNFLYHYHHVGRNGRYATLPMLPAATTTAQGGDLPQTGLC